MSQQSEAATSLDELARCVDALLGEPAKRAVARNLVERYLDDAAQETKGTHGSLCRTTCGPSTDPQAIWPESALGLGLADRLPTDRTSPYGWTASRLDETSAKPLTPEQTAAALVALHATRCAGVERVIEVSDELPEGAKRDELPKGAKRVERRRAVCWSATQDCVQRLEEHALHWFKLQFRRFEQFLSEQAPKSDHPPIRVDKSEALTPVAVQADPFDDLLAAVEKARLIGMEARVLKEIVRAGGKLRVADADTRCEGDAVSAFKRAKRKISKFGWVLRQLNNELCASPKKPKVRN